jgi:hypothetical protein
MFEQFYYMDGYARRFWLFRVVLPFVVFAVIAASISSSYRPLGTQMTLRYLESQNRAPWQIEQRKADEQKAQEQQEAAVQKARADAAAQLQATLNAQAAARTHAEEAARQAQEAARIQQQQAEEAARIQQQNDQQAALLAAQNAEKARQQAAIDAQNQQAQAAQLDQLRRAYPGQLAEFQSITAANKPTTRILLNNTVMAQAFFIKKANDPDYYQTSTVTEEEASSSAPCTNPTGLFDGDDKVKHNILACALYFGVDQNAAKTNFVESYVVTMLIMRLTDANNDQYHPIGDIFSYIWIDYLESAVNSGGSLDPFPAQIIDGELNPALFHSVMPVGFEKMLIETAPTAEKIEFRMNHYPQMQRLWQLTHDLIPACQALGISPCVPIQ